MRFSQSLGGYRDQISLRPLEDVALGSCRARHGRQDNGPECRILQANFHRVFHKSLVTNSNVPCSPIDAQHDIIIDITHVVCYEHAYEAHNDSNVTNVSEVSLSKFK